MKDFRVEVKIRNNRIFSRIMKRWGSVPLFSRCVGVSYTTVSQYIGFKTSPISKPGVSHSSPYRVDILGLPWKKSAFKIAAALGCEVLDLWPNEYLRGVRNNKYFFEADKEDMLDLPFEDRKLLMAGTTFLDGFNTEHIQDVLNTIEKRERRVIELRFGLNGQRSYSLREIGAFEGVSRERIRQIELKALRKLRHPSRLQHLRLVTDEFQTIQH